MGRAFAIAMVDAIKRLLYRVWLHGRCCCQGWGRWQEARVGDRPKVFYGHEQIPGPDVAAAGGIIKCHDLAQVFPNTLRGANVLYLVSSALPELPEAVVRSALRRGARVVVNQNGVAIPAYHGDRCEIVNAPRRAILAAANAVVYQSAFCKRSSDRFLGPCAGSWRVLHNPVDTAFFCPTRDKKPARSPVLLVAGSHHFRYRVANAVMALSLLRQRGIAARLLVAGRVQWLSDPKDCLEDMRMLCLSLGVDGEVRHIGSYTQKDAPALMNDADILLHTKYLDPCPRLVVEAMACGLPVVYSASGGVPELVGDEAGIGIPAPEDYERVHAPTPELLADGVERILVDYRRFSLSARERAVARFDLAPWLAAHRDLFEAVLQ